MIGLAGAMGVGGQIVIRRDRRPGMALGQNEGCQRRLPQDLAGHPQSVERAAAILRLGPIVRIDQRMRRRIGRGQPHGAPGFRLEIGRIQRHPGIAQPVDPRLDARTEPEVELDVRHRLARPGKPEAAGLEQRRGHRPLPREEKPQTRRQRPVPFGDIVIGMVAGTFGDGVEIQMILQIAADPRQIQHHRHADRPQMLRRPDARQHQQPGRVDRARRQHHLALGPQHRRSAGGGDFHPDRPAGLDHDASDQNACPHGQIGPPPRRLQIGRGGGGAAGIAHGHLIVADALLPLAVEVMIVGNAEFLRRPQEGFRDRQRIDRDRHAERSACGVIGILEALVILRPLEIRQHIGIGPAGAALLIGPAIIIGGIAARVDLRVDRRSPADDLGLRIPDHAPAQMALRHGGIAPGGDALGHLGKTRRHGEIWMPVAAARLQQQHADIRVFRQPPGQRATGRASPHDDIIGHAPELPLGMIPRPPVRRRDRAQ